MLKGIPLESADEILGDFENLCVHRIGMLSRDGGEGFNAHFPTLGMSVDSGKFELAYHGIQSIYAHGDSHHRS